MTLNPWAERCYVAWKGNVRDSLVTRGPTGTFNRYYPVKEAVTWVKFPVWLPDAFSDDIDLETFGGTVDPPGNSWKGGRLDIGFDVPASFIITEMTQADWEHGGADVFSIPSECAGDRVQLAFASGDACLVRASSGDAWMTWQTADGVHVLIKAGSNYSRKRWSADALLVVARSMSNAR